MRIRPPRNAIGWLGATSTGWLLIGRASLTGITLIQSAARGGTTPRRVAVATRWFGGSFSRPFLVTTATTHGPEEGAGRAARGADWPRRLSISDVASGAGTGPRRRRSRRPSRMEVTVGTAALALALLLLPLLYERCGSFRFFCKMGFYNGWILLLALLAIPLCALRGRDVENMKIIRGLMQHVKRLYGIRMEVRGAQNFPPRQPYVVVSNHQSSLDLLGMMEVLPDRCVPIAKRELLYMGAVGVVCWLGGIIFIDRKRTHDAISVMAEAAHTMLSQDVRVWVFPEGTRNHSGSMLPFKRGAFHLAVQAQVPVVPIVISSYQHFYSKRERRFTAGQCVIQVLPPLATRGLGPADVPALTERVRAAMLDAFDALSAELRPTSDPQRPTSDPQRPTSDPRSPTSDPRRPTGDPQRPTSDPRSPISDPRSPTSDPQRPTSDPRSPTSDPQRPISDPRSPTGDPQRPTGDPRSPTSDPQRPTANQSDPRSPTAAPRDPQIPTVPHRGTLQ
ncbi:1-acyl-sn-glycerol-3-phosphate acyltransferase alpha isoform X3 [Poecile atricapillus]|uniref:1-acyl-sn-glycerol-3-phosphate acyltransferase alpha isoform X3 n=1 Tax=Poecile atricapillus TaxID=48891 RepID=UPI002739A79F|nr:1-acyl-sn-glycerol-3-phosphate acyltransferase alpha isoform X3 [Poecile atricapillus]